MTCYSPLKGFENNEDGGILFKRSNNAGKAIDVACGQCIGCRIDKSQMWAARIVHEQQLHDENSFITLTYAENPQHGSLDKTHIQKFMKRLRKAKKKKSGISTVENTEKNLRGRITTRACSESTSRTKNPSAHTTELSPTQAKHSRKYGDRVSSP